MLWKKIVCSFFGKKKTLKKAVCNLKKIIQISNIEWPHSAVNFLPLSELKCFLNFFFTQKNTHSLDSEDDSDCETSEWENQQIRKGVTGAQLVNAQHESVLSRFMIKSSLDNALESAAPKPKSTSKLLEQAYAKCSLEKPQKQLNATNSKKDKSKPVALRSPQEIRESLQNRLNKLKELNENHQQDIEKLEKEMACLRLEEMDCKQKAPTAAAKYRFYQEIKCYVTDLIDCLNEKVRLKIKLKEY